MQMGVIFIEYFDEYVARFCVSIICNYKKFDTIYVRNMMRRRCSIRLPIWTLLCQYRIHLWLSNSRNSLGGYRIENEGKTFVNNFRMLSEFASI